MSLAKEPQLLAFPTDTNYTYLIYYQDSGAWWVKRIDETNAQIYIANEKNNPGKTINDALTGYASLNYNYYKDL